MTDEKKAVPYFNESGDIVIPFDSDPKYHWWAGGQSLSKTIEETKALHGEPKPAPIDPERAARRQALVSQYEAWGREARERRDAEAKGKGRPSGGKK